ncbi:uncharacterized protein LOC107022289 [Solanum pennellii]|uniref:Uncharacterized protein LOC107022289 n=1 Tax=Solanum pennellii TaxID=28526 RepID=A0ABM1H013_SOLPN|nr:uncharacterized protein LOC107022289 [Solanum pennellii]
MGLGGAKPSTTPLETNVNLKTTEFDELTKRKRDTLLENAGSYQRLIGKLLYLTITRPDISYTANTESIHAAAKIVSLGSRNQNWAACPNTRRSVTGYLVKFGSSLVSWKSKKQQTVSRSSAEAEYKSMASVVAKVTWLLGLFQELGVKVTQPVTVMSDSKAALQIASNPIFHERTKQI